MVFDQQHHCTKNTTHFFFTLSEREAMEAVAAAKLEVTINRSSHNKRTFPGSQLNALLESCCIHKEMLHFLETANKVYCILRSENRVFENFHLKLQVYGTFADFCLYKCALNAPFYHIFPSLNCLLFSAASGTTTEKDFFYYAILSARRRFSR